MQIKDIIPAVNGFCSWWNNYGKIIEALFAELDVKAIQAIIEKLQELQGKHD